MSDESFDVPKERFLAEIDMYKFQVDLGVKVAPAILTIAGSLLAFILTREGLPHWTSVLSLGIPLLLCIGFLVMYWIATDGAKALQQKHAATAESLDLDAFDLRLLVGVCRLGYYLCAFAGAGIIVVMLTIDNVIVVTTTPSNSVSLACKPVK